MGFIFFVLLILLILFLLLYMIAIDDIDGWVTGISGIALVVILGFVLPYTSHIRDMSTVNNAQNIISIQEERIERISERLDNVTDKGSSSWNADSPVATMMQSLTSAENKISEAGQDILKAKMSIQRRQHGFTSYVLWFAPNTLNPVED